MVRWISNISISFDNLSTLAKLDKKPIDKPTPDPKPKEASGNKRSRS